MLRGFHLYWYRSPDHLSAKGLISLPNKPIKEDKLDRGKLEVFHLPEGSGRMMTF